MLEGIRHISQQLEIFLDAQPRISNECAECANGKFLVLRNREINAHSGFHQHQMTADLPSNNPPGLHKGFGCFLAGRYSPAAPSSDCNHYRFFARLDRMGLQRLLIFSP